MRDHDKFDRLVDEAWPAPHRVEAGEWVYRHAGGVTKRANSVLPLGEPGDLSRAVDDAEKFYAGLGVPCVFSVGVGASPGLDAELDRRGYRLVDPTLIMTAGVAEAVPDGKIEPAPSARWMETWWTVDGGRHRDGGEIPPREWGARILTGVPAAYASCGDDAVGRGVLQGEWLGVYCMAVSPRVRRQGKGAAVLRTLLDWGREGGARHAYLVVLEANAGARALYTREGFTAAGRYHCRVEP
jgi:GNAT superfamily N-acetyltransferase